MLPENDVKSMTFTQLQERFTALSFPNYRAQQVFDWLHAKGAVQYAEMTNLPRSLQETLCRTLPIYGCELQCKQVSALDSTIKFLFSLHDGCLIESVLMHYNYGYSICISSQVGCKMACVFCASAKNGFVRNLTAGEMLSQIHAAQKETGVTISRVVLMGMGEPLDNYENMLRFLHLVNDANGLHISMRHITLSTCGIVPRIDELCKENLQLTLSVSLHAPNDELRARLMPVNRSYPLTQLLHSCREYAHNTKRRVSFEYALLQGENDSDAHAAQLADLLKGMLCHVNLIPVNPTGESEIRPASRKQTERFQFILNQNGCSATIRRTLGADIDAACGLLRLRSEEQSTAL